jgi:hypothetical protein
LPLEVGKILTAAHLSRDTILPVGKMKSPFGVLKTFVKELFFESEVPHKHRARRP